LTRFCSPSGSVTPRRGWSSSTTPAGSIAPSTERDGWRSGRRPARAAPRPHAPGLERAKRIGQFWSHPQSRAITELLEIRDGLAWIRKQVEQADTDLLQEMMKLFCERVMGEEVDAICGASYGERSEDRTTASARRTAPTVATATESGPGDTRTGTVDPAVPKLREGSYFAAWLLESRRRAERAFVQVVCEPYGAEAASGSPCAFQSG
jgi:Transposase, Mutator family